METILYKLPVVAGIILAAANIFITVRSDEYIGEVYGLDDAKPAEFKRARHLPIFRIVLAALCVSIVTGVFVLVELSRYNLESSIEGAKEYSFYVLLTLSYGFVFFLSCAVGVALYFMFRKRILEFRMRHGSKSVMLSVYLAASARSPICSTS